MILEVIWFIFFWFAAAWCVERLQRPAKNMSISSDEIGRLGVWGCGFLFCAAMTLDMIWETVVVPLCEAINRFVPESGAIHNGTVAVVVLATLAGYICLMVATPTVLRFAADRLKQFRNRNKELRHV